MKSQLARFCALDLPGLGKEVTKLSGKYVSQVKVTGKLLFAYDQKRTEGTLRKFVEAQLPDVSIPDASYTCAVALRLVQSGIITEADFDQRSFRWDVATSAIVNAADKQKEAGTITADQVAEIHAKIGDVYSGKTEGGETALRSLLDEVRPKGSKAGKDKTLAKTGDGGDGEGSTKSATPGMRPMTAADAFAFLHGAIAAAENFEQAEALLFDIAKLAQAGKARCDVLMAAMPTAKAA
jgi:hypothetical protein